MARKTRSSRKSSVRAKQPTLTAVTSETEVDVADTTDNDVANGDTTDAATPVVETLPEPEVSTTLGKRELIDRVVITSGIKKKAAKPVVEAMLKELGEALSRGDTLNLQPLGKGIVKNRKSLENAEVVELRLRRSKLAMAAAEAAMPGTSEPVDADTTDSTDADVDSGSDSLTEAAE